MSEIEPEDPLEDLLPPWHIPSDPLDPATWFTLDPQPNPGHVRRMLDRLEALMKKLGDLGVM